MLSRSICTKMLEGKCVFRDEKTSRKGQNQNLKPSRVCGSFLTAVWQKPQLVIALSCLLPQGLISPLILFIAVSFVHTENFHFHRVQLLSCLWSVLVSLDAYEGLFHVKTLKIHINIPLPLFRGCISFGTCTALISSGRRHPSLLCFFFNVLSAIRLQFVHSDEPGHSLKFHKTVKFSQ